MVMHMHIKRMNTFGNWLILLLLLCFQLTCAQLFDGDHCGIDSLHQRYSPRHQLSLRFHAKRMLDHSLASARSRFKQGRLQKTAQRLFCCAD